MTILKRKSGILLHITSLPCDYGIGDLGPCAYRFVDFLNAAKQSHWQILPINPTDGINEHSPYSSTSAFAGNPLLISPEKLAADGYINNDDIAAKPSFPEAHVDFEEVRKYKELILNLAFDQFNGSSEFDAFVQSQSRWLNDYALFVAINHAHNGVIWTQWPDALRKREANALLEFEQAHIEEINRIKFIQYLFFKQWSELKEYCAKNRIGLIGDLPIYMNFDSADVWAHPQNYKLDEQYRPVVVSGVPPDYFSETGQRWGNPVYNWERLKERKFDWWVGRVEHNFNLFDIVRIDHFRGLVQCWEIPAADDTAVNGRWSDVPTDEFFQTLVQAFGEPLPVIAEDLGFITDDVREAMKKHNLPGMKVLLFAFSDGLDDHPYLPHNFQDRCAVYTGTHDNNTVLGWFREEASDHERANLHQYLQRDVSEQSVCHDLIRLAYESQAEYAIVPLQDFLELGGDARMNKPATTNGNWAWRMSADAINDMITNHVADITTASGRN